MTVDRAQQEATFEKFMVAVTSGDVQGLMDVLAPDVVLIADGGGFVPAARKPLIGAERVLAFLARVADLSDLVATTVSLNGMPGARFNVAGDDTAVSLVIENDLITRIFAIRNPNKLRRLEEVAVLRR
jgi:RNA polymerase sigma-70 factor (ECF subfamily)